MTVKDFICGTCEFYDKVMGLYDGDVALFEAPRMFCGKPTVFIHRDDDWELEEKSSESGTI